MKKENVVKQILMKALPGFSVGITLLIIAYASVYFILGQDVFDAELYQLHNIDTLIFQAISAGLSGYLLFVSFYTISTLQKIEDKLMAEHPYKSVLTIIISSICVAVITVALLANTKIFSKNISSLNTIILIIVYMLSGLVFCIKSVMEKHIIKEINQKLKEKNNK